ncbi:MAG: galactoside ABC transporter permease [Bacilli bacterium]|nr:galactoside ABC transporter permease [Bacilli bacterium]
MNKTQMNITQKKKVVEASHKKYIDATIKFANKQISKDEYKNACHEFALTKKEILSLNSDLSSKDYDPAISFAYEFEIEKDSKEVEKELTKLTALRKDGEDKVRFIKEEIRNIRLRKNITSLEKNELIKPLRLQLIEAKAVAKENKAAVKASSSKLRFIIKKLGKISFYYSKVTNNHNRKVAKNLLNEKINKEQEDYLSKLKTCSNKKEQRILKAEHNSKLNEYRRDYQEIKTKCHDEIGSAFANVYSLVKKINNKYNIQDKINIKLFDIKHNFKLATFLRKYSLYIVILIFFVVCAIIAQLQGNPLLTFRTLETICIQSSTKVFFSLGVAGLILLGGTDLSIGRMTGMAASFSCLFLSQLVYETNFGTIDMSIIPQALAIFLGLLVCVLSTTLFSTIAGFFTAKFKIHPFITTLSTQLLIYGLMMVCFSQVPAFTMNSDIKVGIVGELGWQLVIYAVIAIVLIWLIWNKTKFGKHMYAVGDNKEAAKVSGINVFWITMGVFIMAGVLYGVGGFLEGARIGNANPSTALGTELDAIAACVIGGISFSGGKGKVSGAVIGTLVFSTLTYCLTFIGLDINYQFIFKGVIILAAVCFDSLKFLKKQ